MIEINREILGKTVVYTNKQYDRDGIVSFGLRGKVILIKKEQRKCLVKFDWHQAWIKAKYLEEVILFTKHHQAP